MPSATFTVKPGAPTQTFKVWLPSQVEFQFQPTASGASAGPSLTTSDERDAAYLFAHLWLNGTGSTDPYVPPVKPKGLQLSADGDIEAVDRDSGATTKVPVASGAPLDPGGEPISGYAWKIYAKVDGNGDPVIGHDGNVVIQDIKIEAA